ncbi:MAG: arsenate reductase ArsC [Elusimicrobia bacterium]|nr:arsenate reductase ArsC [Elusimicrobiota bacterium]MDE2313716.1 arsenate reductase ArsC [Elusimicrobiota bacterium]
MKSVLFVCVENSCRSQMAEAFARHLGAGVALAQSAGSKPGAAVHPMAVELMREKGIDLSGCRPKGLDAAAARHWDFVITMGCGEACPFVPAAARRDWAIADPKALSKEKFREVRDLIEKKVRDLIDEIRPS